MAFNSANSSEQDSQAIEDRQNIETSESSSSDEKRLNAKLLRHLMDLAKVLQKYTSDCEVEELIKRNAAIVKKLQTRQLDHIESIQRTDKEATSVEDRERCRKETSKPPKRATTAYNLFRQHYIESVEKAGRDVSQIEDFGMECAKKWNSMSENEKMPFNKEAEKDRKRYCKEMEIYRPFRDLTVPKRPDTAFMIFMVDFRKEIAGRDPEGGTAALAKLGGERWRSMSEAERKPYVDRQDEGKATYETQMEEYRRKQKRAHDSTSSSDNEN